MTTADFRQLQEDRVRERQAHYAAVAAEKAARAAVKAAKSPRASLAVGQAMPDQRFGIPVIAVGDPAAFESHTQAKKFYGLCDMTFSRAMLGRTTAAGRPWMVATVGLLKTLAKGGWKLAVQRQMVRESDVWACGLGPIPRRENKVKSKQPTNPREAA